MKMITLLLTFFVSLATFATPSSAQRRSNRMLRFIAEQQNVRNAALLSVIGARCDRYAPENEKKPCRAAVKKMLELLDYDVIFGENVRQEDYRAWSAKSYVFVAFRKNLVQLLNQTQTSTYLNQLNQELYRYLTDEIQEFNVWEFSKKFYGSEATASMVIAALFQDTSIMKLHLAYFTKIGERGSAQFQSNRELLSRVIDTINLILDSSEENYRKLFYPQEIQRNLNRNIYHFYVPLYLSRLLAANSVSNNDAFRAVLMLTLTYEFITTTSDYRYLYQDPERISLEGKVKDIFGGFCGSNLGIGRRIFNKNFEKIRETFDRSTEEGVQLLLRR